MAHIGLLPKEGIPYKQGTLYGNMTNGIPDSYGIYIEEYILYDGFFNDQGAYDGYGYLSQRKPYPGQSWLTNYLNEYDMNKNFGVKRTRRIGLLCGAL